MRKLGKKIMALILFIFIISIANYSNAGLEIKEGRNSLHKC